MSTLRFTHENRHRDSSSGARSSSVIYNRGAKNPAFFPKTYDVGQTMTIENVDTCCGMAPGLKCPPCYREDASGRFKHARPRKRDAANTAFVPFFDPFSLISAWSVKNGATRMGRTSA